MDAPDVRFNTDEEYVEAFRDIYSEAVRCRLHSKKPVATTLSGGLDSSSVTALANREGIQSSERIAAYSAIPLYDTRGGVYPHQFGDEKAFIHMLEPYLKGVDIHYVDAAETTPLAGLASTLHIREEPEHAAVNMYWILAILQKLKEAGIGTLLTGQFGNATVSWNGNRAQLLKRLRQTGNWETYRMEVIQWKKCNKQSWISTLKNQVISPLLPLSWARQYRLITGGYKNWMAFSAINPKVAITLGIKDRLIDGERMLLSQHNPEYRSIMLAPGNAAGAFWSELGAHYDVEIRDPTADKRIIEYCFGIPENQYTQRGQEKMLIRRGMAGLMPDSFLWNKQKGKQAADIIMRIRHSSSAIRDSLKQLQQSDLAQEYLDLPYMETVFKHTLTDINPLLTNQAGTVLLKGIMVGLFLQRFEK